jgi:hypothetical protein
MKKTLSLITAALILSTLILSSCSKQPSGNNGSGIDIPPLFTFADVNLDEFKKDSSEIILADDTVFFLTENGEVYGLGANKYCELGLGHNLKAEKAVRVPIEEKIAKIRALDGRVFFISENGTLYITGRKDSSFGMPAPEIKECYSGVHKVEILRDEKVVDVSVSEGYGGFLALVDDDGYGRILSVEISDTKGELIHGPNAFPIISGDVVSIKTATYVKYLLNADGELYRFGWFYEVGGREEENIATKAAENVEKYWSADEGAYYVNSKGELFAAGRIEDYDGNDLCLGIDREKYSKYILKNTIYPTNLYTYEFCKIDMPEKVINYLDFGDAKAVIGESGKVYVWGNYDDLPKNFLPEGETDKRYPVFSGYTFENIENLEKIVSNRQNHLDITYAVKYSGENWKICFNDESRGVSVGEEIDIKNLPWWK